MQLFRVLFLFALLFVSLSIVKANEEEFEIGELELLEIEEELSQAPSSNGTDLSGIGGLGNVTGTTDTNTSISVTSKPAPVLKPALIFYPKRDHNSDEPLTGKLPSNLTKPHITEHIYGGAVEFRKGRDNNGCPCKEVKPEKYRYDTEFKAEKAKKTKCSCGKKKKGKKSKFPPIVAALYPKKNKSKKTKPCAKTPKKKVEKIAPEYRAAKPKAPKKAPCAKPTAPKNATIAPEFYPARKHHKHRGGKIVKKLKKNWNCITLNYVSINR